MAWYKDTCPKCDETNWVDNGDEQDLTMPDIEAITCWSCKHSWWWGECDVGWHGENADPVDCAEDGVKTPS